jgi:hypothetical protein
MMIKKTIKGASIALLFSLTGCMGVYEGGFECLPGVGVGCKSISEVNQMVNQGELPQKPLPDLPQPSCKHCESNLDPQRSNPEEVHIWYSPWAWEEA